MAAKTQSTQKKSSSPSKKSTPRKSVTTKKQGAKKAPRLTWKFYTVTIGIFAVAIATIIVIALFTASILTHKENQARLERIEGIYAAIDVGDEYKVQSADIFGDKRPYGWAEDRTYSSSMRYTHGDTVSNTVADLDAKIKAAGFTFIDEPYPGSTSVQYHYKSAKNEFVRLSVSSKPYDDAWFNYSALNKDVPQEVYDMDKNAGPVNVTLKVNLDDNNE